MTSINLLPIELRQDIARKQWKQGIKLFMLGIFSLMLICYLVLCFLICGNKLKLIKIEKNLVNIQPKQQQLVELKKEIEHLNSQIRVLKSLEEKQTYWHKFLWELNELVPADMWLVDLTGNFGQKITIKGQCLQFSSIGLFLKQLSQSPFLADIELLKVEKVTIAEKKIYYFELQARLVRDVGNNVL